MQKHVILVAGTHRSGTSLLNRLLNIHGVHLPIGSDYKNEFNERGYWESFDVQKINDKILKLGDSSWFDVRPFSLAKQSSDVIEQLEQEVSDYCASLLAQEAEIFSIKDPRVCRLIPIWRSALENIGVKVSAIIPYRHPLEVAASLKHRDGFDTNYCLSIWLRNFFDAELATRDLDRAFCSYQSIFSDWPVVFRRISEKLGLASLRSFSEVQNQVDEFISAPLKHWSYSESDLAGYVGPDGLINRTYQLLKLIGQDDNETIRIGLDGIREKFDESRLDTDELRTRTKDEARIKSLRESLKNIELDLEQQKSNVRNLKRNSANARQQIENLKSQNRELTENVDGLTRLLEHSRQSEILSKSELQAMEVRITDKDKENTDLAGHLGSLNDAYTQQTQELAVMTSQFNQKSFQFQAILDSYSWKITWPLRLLAKYLFFDPARSRRAWSQKSAQLWQRLFSGNRIFAKPFTLTKQESDSRVYVPITTEPPPKVLPVKLIAFYLPQFHAIPENDEWWGEGFTEWTNVTPARPQFKGHYQPRVPGELGYYNLRDIRVQKRQIELAKLYGVSGFCFYFYWFNGQRLLETPLLHYLESEDLDLPFCLCWANEPWSRTWDGLENDILIGQEHSDADDLAFIEYVSKYFKSDRYICVDGKPLLIVYRPNLFPDAVNTAVRWREWCKNNGIGEIFIAYPQSFEAVDPAKYGFDAAIEFPPNNSHPETVTENVTTLSEDFSGIIYDWTSIASRSRQYSKPDYPLFRTVNPSWDNTARRRNAGAIFIGSTPEAYEEWLENAAKDTVERFSSPSQRLTFVNAWNEWAEGAYLEPDREYGYAYLQATRNALENVANDTSDKTVVLVTHDAHPHGAQYIALYIAKALCSELGFQVDLVTLGDGILLKEFERWTTVYSLAGVDHRGPEAKALARKLALLGNQAAIVNTTVSGIFLETLADAGLRCISLVHELRSVIDSYELHEHAAVIARHATSVVFPAQIVADSFQNVANVPAEHVIVRPQGLYKKNAFRNDKAGARSQLREALGLDETTQIVLGVGYLDHRKGVDLFVDAGIQVIESMPATRFVWVGHWEPGMQALIEEKLAHEESAENFLFVGRKDDTDMYFAGADVFVLSSREDPFPSTVMESLDVSVPVIGFEGAGGSETLLNRGCGQLVPFEDSGGLADAIMMLLNDPEQARMMGETGASIIRGEMSYRRYAYDLLDLCGSPQKRVSAIVPNYNYARHLEQRLTSIFSQTHPVFEVIVLDDASTDNSIDVIRQAFEATDIDCQLIPNDQNSGSVSKQWQKGVHLARGEFVWICEADDYCEPTFIEENLKSFDHDDVVLSYSQSKQVDDEGKLLSNDYLDYTNDICTQKWRQNYVNDGTEELAHVLAVKNCIPNVSAVVFRKTALEQTLDRCIDDMLKLTVTGDWLVYSDLLQQGRIGFVSKALNNHRRHQESVTHDSSNNEKHMAEILYMQDRISRIVKVNQQARDKAIQFEKHAFTYLNLGNPDEDAREHKAVSYRLKQLSQ